MTGKLASLLPMSRLRQAELQANPLAGLEDFDQHRDGIRRNGREGRHKKLALVRWREVAHDRRLRVRGKDVPANQLARVQRLIELIVDVEDEPIRSFHKDLVVVEVIGVPEEAVVARAVGVFFGFFRGARFMG